MVEIKNVHGSAEQAIPVIVGKDTVYVHTNIHQEEIQSDMDDEPRLEWVYDEIQYTLQEYIQVQADEQRNLQNKLLDAQLAICDMYESMGE